MFTGPRRVGACRAPAPKRKPSGRPTKCQTSDVDEDYLDDTVHSEVLATRSAAKKQSKGREGEVADATLMITLVHRDLLVVQGAAFEVS